MISEETSNRIKLLLGKTEKLRVARKNKKTYGYVSAIVSMERYNEEIVVDLLEECDKKEKK